MIYVDEKYNSIHMRLISVLFTLDWYSSIVFYKVLFNSLCYLFHIAIRFIYKFVHAYLKHVIVVNVFIVFYLLLVLLQHGDIETNPGPSKEYNQYLSCCHWNLNSLPSHNYAKVSLLQAYNSIYKHDIICISETYLDSSVSIDDKSLCIEGYNLTQADHPGNIKRERSVYLLQGKLVNSSTKYIQSD